MPIMRLLSEFTIVELFDEGTTRPTSILASLRTLGITDPPKSQLNNFLASYRRQKYGQCTISVSESQQWCQTRKSPPTDLDEPFVVSSNISCDLEQDNPELQIFMSTKRLLQLPILNTLLQVDATYKLVWQGYPVLTAGTSDKNRVFHKFGIAVCYGEASEDFRFLFAESLDSLKLGDMDVTDRNLQSSLVSATKLREVELDSVQLKSDTSGTTPLSLDNISNANFTENEMSPNSTSYGEILDLFQKWND